MCYITNIGSVLSIIHIMINLIFTILVTECIHQCLNSVSIGRPSQKITYLVKLQYYYKYGLVGGAYNSHSDLNCSINGFNTCS